MEEGSGNAEYEILVSESTVSVMDSDTVTIKGKEIDTIVLEKVMKMEYRIDDDEQETVTEVETVVSETEWISLETYRTVESEEETFDRMTMTFGEGIDSYTSIIESRTFMENAYLEIDETVRYPLEEGDEWSSTETYSSSVVERSRYKYGDEPFSWWE